MDFVGEVGSKLDDALLRARLDVDVSGSVNGVMPAKNEPQDEVPAHENLTL